MSKTALGRELRFLAAIRVGFLNRGPKGTRVRRDTRCPETLAAIIFGNSLLVSLPIAFFNGGALVVLFFT